MITHSSIRAWRIPWTESLVDNSPQGLKDLDMTEVIYHACKYQDISKFPGGKSLDLLARSFINLTFPSS